MNRAGRHHMGITGPQMRVLVELDKRSRPPVSECWLIEGAGAKYHLVVRTMLEDNEYKLTTTPAVIGQLHGGGLIAYGNDITNLVYWRDETQHRALVATPVLITDRGKQVQRDAARFPRHAKAGA